MMNSTRNTCLVKDLRRLKMRIGRWIAVVTLIFSAPALLAATLQQELNLTPTEIRWLKENPTLDFHLLEDSAPDSFWMDGEVKGAVPELLNIFERKLGVKINPLRQPYSELSAETNVKNVMAVGFMSGSSIQQFPGYVASEDLFKSYFSLFAMESKTEKFELQQLANKNIAVFSGLTHPIIEQLKRTNNITEVDSFDELVGSLLSRKVDYFLDYRELANYLLYRSTTRNIKEIHTFAEPDDIVFMVREDQSILLSILNKLIIHTRVKELPKIIDHWYLGENNFTRLTLSQKEKEWLRLQQKIILGWTEKFPPSLIVDKEGNQSGIFVDIYNLISERIGVDIELKIIDWNQAGELLVGEEIVGLAGATDAFPLTDEMIKLKALTSVVPTWFGRMDDVYPLDDPDRLKGKRIAYVKGFKLVEPLIAHLGTNNTFVAVDSTLDGMRKLVEQRVDYYVGSNVENYWLSQFPNFGLIVKYMDFNKASSVSAIIHAEQPELVSILNKAINEIGKTAIDNIVFNWTLQSMQGYAVSLSEKEKEIVAKSAPLNLAIAQIPPYFMVDDNGVQSGVFYEYLQVLNSKIGANIQLTTGANSELINNVINKKLDGVAMLSSARIEKMDLLASNPHFITSVEVYGKQASDEIRTPSDMIGKKVAYSKDVLLVKNWVESKLIGQAAIAVESSLAGFQKLLTGELDYYVGMPSESYFIKSLGVADIVSKYSDLESSTPLMIGLNAPKSEWIPILNKGIASISEVRKNSIQGKWIDVVNKPNAISPFEELWLSQFQVFNIAASSAWAPFDFTEDSAAHIALADDFLKVINEKLGVGFNKVQTSGWEDSLMLLEKSQIDVIPGLPIELNSAVKFTDPILKIPLVVAVVGDASMVVGMDGLRQRDIIVVENSASHKIMKREFPGGKIVLASSISDAIEKLERKAGEGLLVDNISLNFWLKKLYRDDINVAFTTPYFYDFTFAVREDLAPLISVINKSISSLSEREKSLIIEKWINQQPVSAFDWSTILFWGGAAGISILILFSFIVFWNRKLALEVETRQVAEQKAHLAEQKAIDANKAKSVFLANMSHEIRTPMNAILGYVQLLQNDHGLDSEHKKLVGTINQSGKHLLALINDILDMSKIEAGRMELNETIFNLHNQLKDIEAMLRYRAEEKGLSLKFHYSDHIPEFVYADQAKLSQILINLLGNAIKFTQEGEVSFSMHVLSNSDTTATIEFIVKDSGVGIPASRKLSVFEPFSQAQEGHIVGGTGLGLPISREIARLMGGDITLVDSSPKGAEFSIRVQLKKSEKECAEETNQAPSKPIKLAISAGKPTVLVVDDIVTNRELLKYGLTKFGFNVITADDGLKGIEAFKEYRPKVVIMDILMPTLSGVATTEKIRQLPQGSETKVIALTAGAIEVDKPVAEDSSFDAVMYKPVNLRELLSKIAELCRLELEYDVPQLLDNSYSGIKVIDVSAIESMPPELRDKISEALRLGKIADLREQIEPVRAWNQTVGNSFEALILSFQLDRLKKLFLRESQY
ncbi:transporter substrate-binding domain-containing protein [Aliikangiella marina]|uniref:Sensory/regulatory protein RpfC n=1 Tax=Aliikangiella marina TaxID=1712262 RepID=A0A545TE04_9GAMM|nr:transporter substrate-binding domain-containing protein [Aliikangiella marina]TQV75396.1 transporter substrate-binding domain-containing protein [Aliikangiella marina]